jgi:hypothetical protein
MDPQAAVVAAAVKDEHVMMGNPPRSRLYPYLAVWKNATSTTGSWVQRVPRCLSRG